jgi:pimeloyl-ACP methyl ester carboxylesterase
MTRPEVLRALDVGDHILVGHSDGASIALISAGARNDPTLKGVIVEAPHVFVEDISVSSIARIRELYDSTDMAEKLARHHGANIECAFRGWNDVWLEAAFLDWNIEEYLAGIRVPLLVIQGADDEYGTPAQVQAIADQAGAPVEVNLLADCGHSPHRDQTKKTLSAMTRFIAQRG